MQVIKELQGRCKSLGFSMDVRNSLIRLSDKSSECTRILALCKIRAAPFQDPFPKFPFRHRKTIIPARSMLAPPHFAVVTWDPARGRRMCPLATFGARAPATLAARLVCVDPPRADCATVANAAELRGAVALVVRGGCSFALKARRVQAAGAVAMVLANNTRDEPFAAFTMGEEEATDGGGSGNGDDDDDRGGDSQSAMREPITIPCVMMCLFDVRELFKQFPPTVKTGTMKIEVLDMATDEAQTILAECSRKRQLAIQSGEQLRGAGGSAADGGGWGGFRRWKTSSIRKLLDPQVAAPVSVKTALTPVDSKVSPLSDANTAVTEPDPQTTTLANAVTAAPPDLKKAPLFAFVQWATSTESYEYHFAPLAEFGLAGSNSVYEGNLIPCDPILADEVPLKNGFELSNAIALVKRGACTFPTKIERIQSCGAVAAIIGNDDEESPDAAFVMSVDHIKVDHVTIPSVMVSFKLFQRLATESVKFVRIICLSGDAAAHFMMNVATPFMLADVPPPTTEAGKEALHSFHFACRAGDHGACQRILDESCSRDSDRRQIVRAHDLNRLTALHHACVGGNEHVLSLLVSLGAILDAADIGMQTPLHIACMYSHDNCVRALIKAGVGQTAEGRLNSLITKQNIGGSTPLHYAAAAGSTECLEILLTANARVDEDGKYLFDGVSSTDHDGSTPIHVACKSANPDCVMYLIAASARLDAVDNSGHTPLQICCEMANDPELESASLRMIEKLMSAGARVSDPEGATGELFLDRIESRTLKRELEVMYFRHEAHASQQKFREMELEVTDLRNQLTTVQSELKSVVTHNMALEAAREATRKTFSAQQVQIDHLHAQMKMIIQILHSQNEASPLPGAPAATSLIMTSDPASSCLQSAKRLAEVNGLAAAVPADEETLSQEAALARDLGRKFAREQKFAVAEMYFEKSLELFPLPGVHRLLEQVRKLRHETEQRKSLKAVQQQRPTTGNHLLTLNKTKLLQHLRNTLHQSQAPERALQSVEREISKLEALQEGSPEFETARKWIEWLVALPWGDPFSGLQNADLFASRQDVFEQINLLEQEVKNGHRQRAARVIQRAFREHFSVHILRRSIALVRIQAIVRGCIARRRFCALLTELENSTGGLTELHENQAQTPSKRLQNTTSNFEDKQRSQLVDYSLTLDTAVRSRLRQASNVTVVAGAQFLRYTKNENGVETAESSGFRVLQLLRSSVVIGKHENAPPLDMPTSSERIATPEAYYVWNRWGNTTSAATTTQCTLSGPYDELAVAKLRYDRAFREQLQNNFVVFAPPPPPSLESCSAVHEKSVRPAANFSVKHRTGDQMTQPPSWSGEQGSAPSSLLRVSTSSA